MTGPNCTAETKIAIGTARSRTTKISAMVPDPRLRLGLAEKPAKKRQTDNEVISWQNPAPRVKAAKTGKAST